eukprot:2482318-Rhodomonas_salina.1
MHSPAAVLKSGLLLSASRWPRQQMPRVTHVAENCAEDDARSGSSSLAARRLLAFRLLQSACHDRGQHHATYSSKRAYPRRTTAQIGKTSYPEEDGWIT